jgi:hypothetical protein
MVAILVTAFVEGRGEPLEMAFLLVMVLMSHYVEVLKTAAPSTVKDI